MIFKPVIHPKSYQNESPIGYLVRLAEENGYDRYNWLFDSQSEQYKPVRLRDLNGHLSNIPWCGYDDNSKRSEILSLSDKHLLMTKVRLCPLCLRENLYWKIDWHQRIYVACPKHKVWMIEECPNCGEAFQIKESKLSQCECKFDFREYKGDRSRDNVLKLMRFLQGDDNELGEELGFKSEELSSKERSNLIHFMAKHTKPSGIRTQGKNKDLQHISSAKQNIANTVDVFLSGKDEFESFLENLLKNEDSKNLKLLSFSHFYKELYSSYPGERFNQHKRVIERFINRHWKKEINNRHRNFSRYIKQNHPWISLARASREFGLSKAVLDRCIEQKMVRAHVTNTDKRRSSILYKPDIEKALPVINDIVDAKTAAVILGVTKSQLKLLVDRQEFKHAMPPKKGFCPTWQFFKSELESYLEMLTADTVPSSGESISISGMMSYFSGRADNLLLNVLEAIRNKILEVEGPISEQSIRAIRTNKAAFLKWYRDKFADSDFMSIGEISHKLFINQEFAYQLVNNGLLETSSDSKNPSSRKVSVSQFEDFKQEYVLLSKLSQALGQSSAHIFACLRCLDVYPVDHEMENKMRQKVYKRQKLVDIPQYSSLVESMVA